MVRLPEHVAWSPPYEYDLSDRRQRCRAYQRVMTEGLAADVLWFIDVAEVVAMWGDMVLSPHTVCRGSAGFGPTGSSTSWCSRRCRNGSAASSPMSAATSNSHSPAAAASWVRRGGAPHQ